MDRPPGKDANVLQVDGAQRDAAWFIPCRCSPEEPRSRDERHSDYRTREYLRTSPMTALSSDGQSQEGSNYCIATLLGE